MTTATGLKVTKKRVQTFLTPLEIERLKRLADSMQISNSEFIARAFRTFADDVEAKQEAEAKKKGQE